MGVDLALTEEDDGSVLVHRANCPYARARAAAGKPVLTMIGCKEGPGLDLKQHSCLDPEDRE